jgi:hypothetical protein
LADIDGYAALLVDSTGRVLTTDDWPAFPR